MKCFRLLNKANEELTKNIILKIKPKLIYSQWLKKQQLQKQIEWTGNVTKTHGKKEKKENSIVFVTVYTINIWL